MSWNGNLLTYVSKWFNHWEIQTNKQWNGNGNGNGNGTETERNVQKKNKTKQGKANFQGVYFFLGGRGRKNEGSFILCKNLRRPGPSRHLTLLEHPFVLCSCPCGLGLSIVTLCERIYCPDDLQSPWAVCRHRVTMLNPNPRGHEHKIPGGDLRSVKCMDGPGSLRFLHTWTRVLCFIQSSCT